MKLENQVVSLELARKMKELGFKQESIHRWRNKRDIGSKGKFYWILSDLESGEYRPEEYSAYTVAELGEMLLREIKINNSRVNIKITKTDDGWCIRYVLSKREGETVIKIIDISEANARAKMLIYLAEQGLINPKEIKI